MKALRVAVLVAAVSMFGCGGAGRFVGRGMDAYKFGNYGLAVETFDYIEKENLPMNPKGEVRLLVYRGLSLVHLGKKDEGRDALIKGRAAYRDGDPKWLPPEIVTEMDETLAHLGVK
jgi:hypothetical protein